MGLMGSGCKNKPVTGGDSHIDLGHSLEKILSEHVKIAKMPRK